jgi:hypothetical protein
VGKNARSESERPSETARGMPNRTLHVSNGKKNGNAAQVSTLPLQYLTRVGELYSNSGHGKGRLFTGSDEMGGCNFFGRRYEQAADLLGRFLLHASF